MADDIDIEEHDILDNPRIQDILHIKEEPIDLDQDLYEEPTAYDENNHYEYDTEEKYEDQGHADDQIPPYDQETAFVQDGPHETEPPEMVFENQGMGFNDQNADFNESGLESNTEPEYIPDLSNEIYHHNNKIILGTKPCKRPTRDVNAAYVSLEDWSVRLENSHCYCKECQTLFATRNALDAHNMIAHSFLVALDSPENSEPETTAEPEKTETAKYCDHCKKYFPSDHALIQHLYDLITANKQAPAVQQTVKYSDCTNTGQHMVYSCLICNSAYLDIKWFRVHMRTVHNKSEEGNYEYIPFTGVCKICNNTSTHLKRFNCHVKAMHIDKNSLNLQKPEPESLDSSSVKESQSKESENLATRRENEVSQSEDEVSQAKSKESTLSDNAILTKRNKKSNFMCAKCKTLYSSIDSINHHCRKYHNGEKNVIKKLVPKSAVSKVKEISPKASGSILQKLLETKSQVLSEKLKFVDDLVPKNSIFKCNDCVIHYVTCWSAIVHTCTEMISRYQCDVCNKQFRLRDNKLHELQHKYNDAFNTYYISKNMNTKLLFWCQKCAVYFDLRKIQNHTKICNGTSTSVRCKLCEIDVNDILTHMQNHKLHSTKTDFIYIDDLLPVGEAKSPEKDLNRKVSEVISPDKVLKRKLPMDSEPGSSKIKKLDPNQFTYCDLCHTCMKSSPSRIHVTGDCKKIKSKRNCEFCGLIFFTGVPMISHEEFHKNSNVKLKDFTFVNVSDQSPIVPLIPEFPKCDKCEVHDFVGHLCGTFRPCKICNKKFSEPTYKLHLLHHKYLKMDTEVTELIKKYETLASTWNILYLCKECNIGTDTYDDVVLHCQNHYNNIRDCVTRNCDICSLNLEENCYMRHKELHSPTITRDSFKTVVYDYKNLLNNDWLKLFGNLSQAEVHQIVTRSIYVTRFVKMKLILDGPPELTIYKCETCKLYIDPYSIYNHTTQCITVQDSHRKSYSCETCFIPFNTVVARKDHEKLHTTPNITANSFRIVAFNATSDREFNSHLQVDASELELQPKMPIKVLPNSKTALKSVIFYQCRQCRCCSSNAESLIRHKCLNEEELVNCNKCKLSISLKIEKEHRKFHKLNTNITKDHIKLVVIDNNQLVRRKHAGDVGENKTAIKKPLYKLYQCRKCKICYSYWTKHETCSKKCRKCKKCGYLFTHKSYIVHSKWHEQNKNASRNNIKVVTLSQEESAKSKEERRKFLKTLKVIRVKDLNTSQSPIKPKLPSMTGVVKKMTTLYQCHKCKLCSYTLSFVKKHTVCAAKQKNTYTCQTCDLKFKYYGMKYHRAWHRENEDLSRKHLKVLPFKGMKILKFKDAQAPIAKQKDTRSNIISNDDGYKCNSCGATSKKTIFLNKHICKSPEKSLDIKECKFRYYQCEDCQTCVTSKRHYCVPSHRIRSCPRCKLKFSSCSIYNHMQKHAQHKNMTRSKITVIPFRKQLNEESVKSVHVSTNPGQSPIKPVQASTKSVQKVSTVYRCSCGLHFISQKTIERHFTVCSPDHEIPSENCSKCGLLFPTNHLVSHLCNHHSYGKGNIEIKTIPTITYYRCGTCKCLFVNKSRVLKHSKRCDPNNCRRVRCDECELDFYESEIKTHSDLHKTTSGLKIPCRIITINKDSQNLDDNEQSSNDTESDEANASQDDNISDDGNVSFTQFGVKYDKNLYKCKECNTHYLKFDSYIRHIKRNKCNSASQAACQHCGLHFTQVSCTRHTYIHHEKLKLKLDDLVITICDPKTKETYTETASVQNKTPKIPDDKNEHSLEKKVDLFKCNNCDIHFLKAISLKFHIASKIHGGLKYNCSHCGLQFRKNVLEEHINLHHKKLGLGVENFNIVEKVELEQIQIEIAQKSDDVTEADSPDRAVDNDDHDVSKDDEPSETTVTEQETEDIIYFHCVQCNLNFTNTRSIEYHFEGKHVRNSIETCELCGLLFNSLVRHKQHHEGRSSGVFLIQDISDDSDSVNKLYKCEECGVHCMKSTTLIAHINRREQIHGKSRNRIGNCPDCGLLFDKITLKKHQDLHHVKHSLRLEDLVIDTSIGKYKSFKFGSGDNDIVSQSSSEDVATEAEPMEKSEESVSSENNKREVRSSTKSPDSSTKLYKCGKCNVYFLTQATCYKHIIKHTPMDPKEYIECKLCSFQFRIVSLNTHIRKHHKNDFEFDKVLIEEYQPKSEEEKVPKIDIYYAKDKVQSRLITTTTEDAEVNSAEVSQSEMDSADDPDASNHSKETVAITNTDDLDTEMEVGMEETKNVMVKLPSFDIKKENDSFEADCKPDISDGAQNSNEGPSNVNELPSNINEVPSNDSESSEKYCCRFCSESFVSRRAKDFHESLDHLDALKDCPICNKSFNTSVLNELHLQIKNESFTCCVCSQSANVDMLPHHSFIHKHIL